ncbi:MAG: hypothetical protein PHG79_13320 [Methanosarcina sp.]|jgi:hypothetical protein|nr:hypothetical protein [Methanosarcina sp.]MDD3874713.1 hypothetical protein [Methanosarcina sp.]MDD4524056.1 hypothetical protein [Methanosarcina sp.]HHV24432.1 hypothetical protein [Methanosarcina sp.]
MSGANVTVSDSNCDPPGQLPESSKDRIDFTKMYGRDELGFFSRLISSLNLFHHFWEKM